jgi:sugar (pentulose or hexulose) kinase
VDDRYYVGVDVGTTGTKAVVFDDAWRIVSSHRATTPWRSVATGTETDASALLNAAREALTRALADCPPGRVAGVGVAGLGESGVLVDGAGNPLAPVIAWHDSRDGAELASLERRFGASEFAVTTGLPLRQQWSITKHRWLTDNLPETRRAVRRFNVPEWIVRGLGGEEVTEQSLASRTGWLRLHDRTWWPEALEWSGADESLMPRIITAGTPAGVADSTVPAVAGAVLTVAGHDHQAAAVGAEACGVGDQLDSCGTAEALVRSVAPGIADADVLALTRAGITVGWHAEPGRWCLLGATQGGLVLQRVLAMLGVDTGSRAELEAAAAVVDVPDVRVHAPDFGRIDVVGIGDGCSPAQVWRAAVDTVTEQIGVINDAMTAASGPLGRIVVTGGWAHSPTFLAAKQRRLGTVIRSEVAEAGARGAATAARRAAAAGDRR